MLKKFVQHKFLFEVLVKRDFTKKYKRTTLGIIWSALSPLCSLAIMWLLFNNFFGNNVDHYGIYLFSGQIIFSYFTDSTNLCMTSLVDNAPILTKVNVPKFMFMLSQNVSSLINFFITLAIFFAFAFADNIVFNVQYVFLLFPILCAICFNLGIGLILSALFVFFRDMKYLWNIATQLLSWLSAIFYTLDIYPPEVQKMFMFNPLYIFISYFRSIVLENTIPSANLHILAALYAAIALMVGAYFYKKFNHEFLYYL